MTCSFRYLRNSQNRNENQERHPVIRYTQSPEGWRVMISELIGLRLAFPVYLTSFKLRATRIVPRCHFYKRTGHDVQSQQREWTSHW